MKLSRVGIAVIAFFSVIIGATCVAGSARADGLTRDDVRCVNASVRTVYQWLLDYENYKNLDDDIGFDLMGKKRRLVDMIASSPVPSPSAQNTDIRNDSMVFIVLRPLSATDGKFYPRLLIRCQADFAENNSFNHHCELVERNNMPDTMKPEDALYNYRNFGLSKFATSLHAETYRPELNIKGCEVGQTLLQYNFQLGENKKHVERVKTAALGPFSKLAALAEALSSMFDTGAFFSWYYQEFYNAWASSIPQRQIENK